MDKLERLLNLTAALLDADRVLTADDLRQRIGGYSDSKAAFRRTFERDKADLKRMGIPLRTEPVPGIDPPVEGYRLDREEYAGTDLQLDPDELAALHLATNLVRLDGDDSALVRLGAASGPESEQTVGRVPFSDAHAVLIGEAAEHRAVSFLYRDTEREVEPWRLSFSRGHWYLEAWDRTRDAERLYRVDRISGDVTVIGPATAPVGSVHEPLDLKGWELGDGPAIAARVRIDPDQAAYAQHMVGELETEADGSVVATLQVRNVEAFRSFVLSFLEHAEIIEPQELRTDLIEWLEAQR